MVHDEVNADRDPIVAALADEQAELSGLLASLADADWERPSRCEGWTVADVVLHLAQTDEMARASLEGDFAAVVERMAAGLATAGDIDEAVGMMVGTERGQPGPALRDRWQATADALIAAFEATDLGRRVPWVAGELSARTLATTRLAETWIHSGDVAVGLGLTPAPTDRLRPIARLAWRTLPYAFARAGRTLTGPVAFELRGPDGEQWWFRPDEDPATVVRGDALDLCLVAARRLSPAETHLHGEGPDAEAVLDLVRTYA